MRTVKILGKELNVTFNMAVEIAYEEISGEAFDLKKLYTTRNTVCLYAAAIVANNPDAGVTFDDIIYKMTAAEIASLKDAVVQEMTEWMGIPDVMLSGKDKEDDDNDEESEKKN